MTRDRWQRIHRAVYATFNGPLPRRSVLWAALLACGPGAVLSHESAAEVIGLVDHPSALVHVTVPAARRLTRQLRGVRVHYSRLIDSSRNPGTALPRTRVEATVLDLAGAARSIDDAVAWMAIACERGRTTADRLTKAMSARSRVKWRVELQAGLAGIAEGCRSILEWRYLRDVEHAHVLPSAKRQVRREGLGGNIYDDVLYPDFGTVVELDGRAAHPASTAHRDLDRDNIAAMRGDIVLHFGWTAVTESPCRVAAKVAAALASRGWAGSPRCCRRPGCDIVER